MSVVTTSTHTFVDAEWLHPEGGVVAAIRYGEGVLEVPGGARALIPRGLDPEAVATLVIVDFATDAAAAVPPVASAEVLGSGIVAEAIRSRLSGRLLEPASTSPQAIVDTTGRPDVLLDATRRLADGGTLVLAGEPGADPLSIDLYQDVHRRGLEVVGVGPRVNRLDWEPADVRLVAPAALRAGTEPAQRAPWYLSVAER